MSDMKDINILLDESGYCGDINVEQVQEMVREWRKGVSDEHHLASLMDEYLNTLEMKGETRWKIK